MSKQQIKQEIENLREEIRRPSSKALHKLYKGPMWVQPILWIIKQIRKLLK